MRSLLLPGFVLAICFLGSHKTGLGVDGDGHGVREGWKLGVAGTEGDITTQIYFSDPKTNEARQMIVLSNELGAAAVRVTEEDRGDAITWMKYEYRYESFDLRLSKSGHGEVYEQRDASRRMGGNISIVVNDLRVDWSPNDYGSCWLYYSPELIRVQTVKASYYEKQSEPDTARITPALDLQRFKLR